MASRNKLLCWLVLAALLPFLTGATMVIRGPRMGAAGPTYLINQNFEGTGYDNGETWTEAGTVNEDYTTTVLKGAQSLFMATADTNSSSYSSFTGQSTVYAHCRLEVTNSQGWTRRCFTIADSAGNALAGVIFDNPSAGANDVKIWANAATTTSATRLAYSTVYYVWLAFVSSGTCELAISASSTKPSSDSGGNVYVTRTGAAGTAARIYVENAQNDSVIFDNVLVSTSVIGDNPNP